MPDSDVSIAADLSASALAGRPAGVSPEFVATPSGYFHPSCIIETQPGEVVRETRIIGRNGVIRDLAPCAYPHYDRRGQISGDGAPPPTVNGWVANANAVISNITFITSDWTVPSNPSSIGSQVIYLFNGVEPAATGDNIIQPVLGWNQLGIRQWSVAAWDCCKGGNNLHSSPVAVSGGDAVTGYMFPFNSTTWEIALNVNGGFETDYQGSVSGTYNWAFGGVLEAFNITACNQYPATGTTTFSNIAVYSSGTPVAPSWTANVPPASPSCASISASSSTVRITY